MIKHFFKWLELVPLPYYISEEIAYAFMDRMFNKFYAIIEGFIDQGTKF